MNKDLSSNTSSSESDPEDIEVVGSSTDKSKTSDSDDKSSKDPQSEEPTPIQSLRERIVRGLRGAARFFQRHNPFRHDKRSKKIHPRDSEHPASSQSWRVGDLFCILPHESEDDEFQHNCVYMVRHRLPDQYHGPTVRLNRDAGTSSESEHEESDLMGSSMNQSQESELSAPSESSSGGQARLRHLGARLSCPRPYQELSNGLRFRRVNATIITSQSDPVDLGQMNF